MNAVLNKALRIFLLLPAILLAPTISRRAESTEYYVKADPEPGARE